MDIKHSKAFVDKIDKENGILEVVIASDESNDRDGDSISLNSWDLKNFKRNPVILDLHLAERSSTSVIGKAEKIWIDKENKQLRFTPRFAVNENPKAKIIYDLYANGFMSAFSVGFLPYKDQFGTVKNELLEISAVPIPANANALAVMRSFDIQPVEWKELDYRLSIMNRGAIINRKTRLLSLFK